MSSQSEARLEQGLDHQRADRFQQAADAFTDVLKFEPENANAMHYLGLALWQITQQSDEPLRLLLRSMKLSPGSAVKHHNIAAVYGSLGKIDQSTQHYKKALEIKPDYAEAYFNISGIYKYEKDDPLIAKMRTQYAQNNFSEPDQEFLTYALSKAMNDTGCYHEAFHFAIEAARLKKPNYDVETFAADLAELKTHLTKNALQPVKQEGPVTNTPVFIVGMPRSGTTLVETILSRHEDVFAAGELPMIGSISAQMRRFAKENLGFTGNDSGFLPLMPDDHIKSAANSCLEMVMKRANGKKFKRFTDKMPYNAFQLGLIAKMFPGARIIHVRRHPLDTCISCFFQRFRVGHQYSYRLDWLAKYYRHYVAYMDHWRKVLPLPMLEVRYEDLVQDPEKQSRKLMDFIGLDWTDDCLNPQDTDRTVMTASRWQVRQPIYKSSINRWKRYEPYLEPLIENLGGWEWIEKHQKS